MPHETPLIATIVAGLVLAFIFGLLAHRLRIPPLAGYLLAGVAMGPFTPGFVGDAKLAPELAEIGVILLMFGVGLHFCLKDLMSVKAIAIPGALVQIAIATLLGIALAWSLGWPLGNGFVFGLALSVASTVVLLRALQERHLMDSERGRIAVGWLIVEDLLMVLVLVLLPPLAGILGGGVATTATGDSGSASIFIALGVTLGKVGAFIALMLFVGQRMIPWLLDRTARTGSHELFRLAVFAIALGVAYGSSHLFGVSFALGAFFAGMILSESELSQRAAEESLPLRDAFAVLFFVSVGMLFDPMVLVRDPWPVLATFLVIVFGKSLAALLIVLAFRRPLATALTISVSLAQIGEFSFILAGLGITLNLLPEQGRDLILAGAILSILVNPLLFLALDRVKAMADARTAAQPSGAGGAKVEHRSQSRASELSGHSVVIGYGRVGSLVGAALRGRHVPLLVIEERSEVVSALRSENVEAIEGNAAASGLMDAANLVQARSLLVAIPNAFEAGQIIQHARRAQPELQIVGRAHSDAEVRYLMERGATQVIMGEREIARGMVDAVLAS